MVYKVCEFRGSPRIKISEEPGKSTIPGSKKILRSYGLDKKPLFDVLCLSSEEPSSIKVAYDRMTGDKTEVGSDLRVIS